MNKKWIGTTAVAALLIGVLTSAPRADDDVSAADPAAVFKVIEEASKPGAEHAKLQPLVGSWTYTSKLWMAPDQPAIEGSGTIERNWILDGRFVDEKVVGKGPDGKTNFAGRGTIGFDKAQDKFVYTWICTMGTGTAQGVGESDPTGKQFTFETETFCPLRGEKVKMRDELRVDSERKHSITSYQTIDGQEMKMMEMTVERRE